MVHSSGIRSNLRLGRLFTWARSSAVSLRRTMNSVDWPFRSALARVRALTATGTPVSVFISYARKDVDFAATLVAALQARGVEVWIDQREIAPSADWLDQIIQGIVARQFFAFVISPASVTSEICIVELQHATSLKKPIVPVLWRQAPLPPEIARLQWSDFSDPMTFDQALEGLLAAMRRDPEWLSAHARYSAFAAEWSRRGRPWYLLLQGSAITEARRWLAQSGGEQRQPTYLELDFIAASGRFRRLSRTGLAGLVALLVSAGMGWWKQDFLRDEYWRIAMGVSALTVEQEKRTAAEPGSEFNECAKGCPTMVVVPAGKFTMGSAESEKNPDEAPQHEVTIAKPFAVGKFEVTFSEWDQCIAASVCPKVSDNGWGRDDRPVISVNWDDVKKYTAWLSRITRREYRLLTEAEWEYAARAGSQTFADDEALLDKYAWYSGNSGEMTHPVGKKDANSFGIYDMYGNVYEWVEDTWHDSYKGAPTNGSAWQNGVDPENLRILRGGGFNTLPQAVRAAIRTPISAGFRWDFFGFRLARTLNP